MTLFIVELAPTDLNNIEPTITQLRAIYQLNAFDKPLKIYQIVWKQYLLQKEYKKLKEMSFPWTETV